MFFILARNMTSKASPNTGTEPTTVSSKVFPIMRAISHLGERPTDPSRVPNKSDKCRASPPPISEAKMGMADALNKDLARDCLFFEP
jgi:hypothetical protein